MEAAVQKIVNDAPSLPASITYFAAALGRAGAAFGIVGSFFAFGDVPADWEGRYDLGELASSLPPVSAPDPADDPGTTDPYADITTDELQAMATTAGLTIAAGASRADILAALEATQNAQDVDTPDPSATPSATAPAPAEGTVAA